VIGERPGGVKLVAARKNKIRLLGKDDFAKMMEGAKLVKQSKKLVDVWGTVVTIPVNAARLQRADSYYDTLIEQSKKLVDVWGTVDGRPEPKPRSKPLPVLAPKRRIDFSDD
jgi:hypothetical protein